MVWYNTKQPKGNTTQHKARQDRLKCMVQSAIYCHRTDHSIQHTSHISHHTCHQTNVSGGIIKTTHQKNTNGRLDKTVYINSLHTLPRQSINQLIIHLKYKIQKEKEKVTSNSSHARPANRDPSHPHPYPKTES